MKYSLFVLLGIMLLSCTVSSQNLTFSEVVQVEGVSAGELFNKAKKWYVIAFKSSKDVIQLESKEDGVIIGKGSFTFKGKAFTSGTNSTGPVYFTLKVEVKDGKYKYEITDFKHYSLGLVLKDEPKGMTKVAKRDVWKDCNKQAAFIISDLKEAMNKSDEEW